MSIVYLEYLISFLKFHHILMATLTCYVCIHGYNRTMIIKDLAQEILPDFHVQSLGRVWLFVTPWTATRQASLSSVQSLSHVQLCDPMDWSMPGVPVHHQLLEFAQTHVRRVGDAIQPSHPLSSPSPPAFNHSHHQGLFQWVGLCITCQIK